MTIFRFITVFFSMMTAIYTIRFLSYSEPISKSFVQFGQSNICNAVAPIQTFTSSQYDTSQNIQNFLKKFHEENAFLTLIESNSTSDGMIKTYLPKFIPYTGLGVALLIFSVILLLLTCCECKCCKICVDPTETKKMPCVIMGIVLSGMLIAVSVIGITSSKSIETSFQRFACAGTELFSDFSAGNLNMNWLGLDTTIKNLTNIKLMIEPAIQQLPTVSTDTSSLDKLYNTLQSQIMAYYKQSENYTVVIPDKTYESLVPVFIQNLGPPSNASTYSGSISLETQTKYNLTREIVQNSSFSISSLANQTGTSQAIIAGAGTLAYDFNSSLSNIWDLYSNQANKGLTVHEYIADGLFGFFIGTTVISSVVFLITLNIISCQFTFCQRFFKASYICLYLTLFISFIILVAGFPFLFMVSEVCSSTQTVFSNQTVFHNIVTYFLPGSTGVLQYSDTCFFGDGNILNIFGIEQPLSDFMVLYQNLNQANNSIVSSPRSAVIPPQQSLVGLLKALKISTNPEIDDSLHELNKFTNYNVAGSYQTCQESLDTYVLNHVNCTSSDGRALKATDNITKNFGNTTCIAIDILVNNTSLNISDRYPSGNFQTCPIVTNDNYGDYVSSFVTSFCSYFTDVQRQFTIISSNLSTVSADNSKFVAAAVSLVDPITNITGNSLQVINTIGDPNIGIFPNSNCTFAQTDAQVIVDNFCVSYLPSVALAVLLTLLYAFIGMIIICPMVVLEKIEKTRAYEKKRQEESLLKMGDLY